VQVLHITTLSPCNTCASIAHYNTPHLWYMCKYCTLQPSPLAIHVQVLHTTTLPPCNTCASIAHYNTLPLQYMCKYCRLQHYPLAIHLQILQTMKYPLVICTYYRPSVHFCHKNDVTKPGEWSHPQLEKYYHHGCWLILFDRSLVGTS
jgi:hypothetical protein